MFSVVRIRMPKSYSCQINQRSSVRHVCAEIAFADCYARDNVRDILKRNNLWLATTIRACLAHFAAFRPIQGTDAIGIEGGGMRLYAWTA